jgi:hypothetical protein
VSLYGHRAAPVLSTTAHCSTWHLVPKFTHIIHLIQCVTISHPRCGMVWGIGHSVPDISGGIKSEYGIQISWTRIKTRRERKGTTLLSVDNKILMRDPTMLERGSGGLGYGWVVIQNSTLILIVGLNLALKGRDWVWLKRWELPCLFFLFAMPYRRKKQ